MTLTTPGAVLVTGANGGLGSRLVAGLLESGVTEIACHYRTSDVAIRPLLSSHGLDPDHHLFRAELTEEEQVAMMAEKVQDRFGPLWGLINIAGESSNGMSWKLTSSEFIRVLHANLLSTFHVSRAFVPAMREQGGGRIINVSSVIAHSGMAGASHYCAAKAGIEGFTRAVAQEVAPKGVTVNALALGYFDQGIIADVSSDLLQSIIARVPVKRLGKGGELLPLVTYLLSRDSAFMTGQVLHLNGGLYS